MDEGKVVVDSLTPIRIGDITHELARESGFSNVKSLLQTAKYGSGANVYLIRFHYLAPGAWDMPRGTSAAAEDRDEGRTGSGGQSSPGKSTPLQRIRSSTPGGSPAKGKGGRAGAVGPENERRATAQRETLTADTDYIAGRRSLGNPFTNLQGQYLAFIVVYTKLNRRPPAEADFQRYFGVTPPSVHNMIVTLERHGLIKRSPGRARSIEIVVGSWRSIARTRAFILSPSRLAGA
jgi:hypothetical protein